MAVAPDHSEVGPTTDAAAPAKQPLPVVTQGSAQAEAVSRQPPLSPSPTVVAAVRGAADSATEPVLRRAVF